MLKTITEYFQHYYKNGIKVIFTDNEQYRNLNHKIKNKIAMRMFDHLQVNFQFFFNDCSVIFFRKVVHNFCYFLGTPNTRLISKGERSD